MRRLHLALLLVASPLFALDFDPPAPDSHVYLKLRTITPFCAVKRVDIAISGSTVTGTIVPESGVFCPAILFPTEVNVGVVPAGVYTLVLRSETGTELDRGPLIVRDADAAIIVSPVGVTAEGKRPVQVFVSGPLTGAPTVLFDGMPADIVSTGRSIVVTPPPHAPGTVDVTVTDNSGSRKAVAAFTYFDPAAAPDPFVFEPLLFPVA